MKIHHDNPLSHREKTKRAFTLIEMIGVLAVIAILASLLIPKVFSAINDARVNGFCVTVETLKAAIADHYGKYGRLDAVWGTNTLDFGGASGTVTNYDRAVLLPEGLIDKPFVAKIAGGDPQNNPTLQILQSLPGNNGAGYRLDGNTNNTANASFVIEAVLHQVSQADAKDLNDRLDGATMGRRSARQTQSDASAMALATQLTFTST